MKNDAILTFFQNVFDSLRVTGAILIVVQTFLLSCANPIPPQGGDEDTFPPKLDSLASTRNMQIRFEKQDIELTFDEWVELRDAFNQVVVSPPLEYRPTIVRKKKTIVLSFDDREVLRDSATYVINFGEAIRDLTEGNVAPIVFVFSTGDFIDSLSVEGQVVDAYSGEPVKDVLFMLYENLADSVFKTDRPFYFARTDDGGKFKVNNMKSGKFKAVALVDQNLNYRYDNEAEKIAFLDSAIVLSGSPTGKLDTRVVTMDSLRMDSMQVDSMFDTKLFQAKPLVLKLFEPKKQLFLTDKSADKYGKVHLGFNREPYDAIVTYDTLDQLVFLETDKDTLRFWYAVDEDTPFNVYVSRDTFVDTIAVQTGLKEAFIEKAKLKPASKNPSKLPVVAPLATFDWVFNHPILNIDDSRIRLFKDSLKTIVPLTVKTNSHKKRTLVVKAEWEDGLRYDLEIWPGGLSDIFGLPNEDTLRIAWKAGQEKDFGSLSLKVVDLSSDTSYVLRLLKKSGELFKEYLINGESQFERKLVSIPPATYSVEIIEDLDKNGRWTTGDYDSKRQPERIHRATLEEVRANWEVNAEVRFDPQVKPKVTKSTTPSSQTTNNRRGR